MKDFTRTLLDTEQAIVPQGIIYLIPERCKGCRICIDLCPSDVLKASDQTNSKGYPLPEIAPGKENACVQCDFCAMVCPEFAIYTQEAET